MIRDPAPGQCIYMLPDGQSFHPRSIELAGIRPPDVKYSQLHYRAQDPGPAAGLDFEVLHIRSFG